MLPARCLLLQRLPPRPRLRTRAHGTSPQHIRTPRNTTQDKRQRELTISTHRTCAHSTLHETKHQNQAPAGYCRIGVPARCICGPHQPTAHTHSLKWKSQRETISTIYAQGVRARDTLHKTKCQYQTRARGCHSGVPARCTLWPHQPAARTHSHPSRKGEYTTSVQLRCKRIGLRVCS